MQYLRIQKFLDDVRTELIALKLTPRDMIDVQSFVWVGDEKTYQSAEQYWLLGAYWDDVGDMTAKFVGEDRWENGYKDKFLEKVRTVKKGDRVAIKSSYTRKHDLPFNNHGKMISCMDIKARGIVKENKGDGRHLVVEWEKDFDVRTIYFYTYRSTIDLIDKTKYKQTTIPWVFGDEEQDKDWLEEQSVQITPEVLSESSASTIELNRIFYGPPGTGKTHRTIDEALQILDRAYYEENRGNRTKLKLKFDELLGADHIHFVTFHQSFSYEDFVEGIRAVTDESGAIRYIVEDGVFKKICDSASYAVRAGDPIGKSYKVRKVSPDVLVIVKEGGSEVPFTWEFLRELIRLVQSGKIALGDIKKGEVFAKVPDSLLEKHLVNGYSNLLAPLVERLMRSPNRANHGDENPAPPGSPKVLIIDEINRGNPSRIFGELITLIEVSKRKGNDESLEVTLPYSKKRFSIPNNVYLIGTMNTADRSLMGLDIALRRRFSFVEMSPQPDLLNNVEIEGIKVGDVLRAMNERIEVLLDRDHCLGHTYFLPLIASPDLVSLAAIFSNQIMPLLKEYFFEDWERIRWVLNDHRKQNQKDCFVVEPERKSSVLFGAELAEKLQDNRWEINDEAFSVASSYKGILEMPA